MTKPTLPSPSLSVVLTTEEAAEMLRLTPRALIGWRRSGRYSLPFIKIGNLVRYAREDITAWLAERRVVPLSPKALEGITGSPKAKE